MNRQPDRRAVGRGPGHAVAAMGGQVQGIAGAKQVGLGSALQLQSGLTLQYQYPFVPVLVIPETRRAGLALRHDAFDSAAGQLAKRGKNFLRPGIGQIGQKGRMQHA